MAAVISIENLAVSFDNKTPVFDNLNITIDRGEFVTVVGVSGAGKSTLLRVIADLIPPFKGKVTVETAADSTRRPIAMVFQAANLMPWRRVKDNITLGLEGINVSEELKRERIARTLKLVGLEGTEDRWPYQLSGGQRQRIGISRALAVDPDILLMDEPFGALDAITRTGLQDELLRIWKETGKSILFVTHDIEEAAYLGDRVLLLGNIPACIVKEYVVEIDRSGRREDERFIRLVEEIRTGLRDTIQQTQAKQGAEVNSDNGD